MPALLNDPRFSLPSVGVFNADDAVFADDRLLLELDAGNDVVVAVVVAVAADVADMERPNGGCGVDSAVAESAATAAADDVDVDVDVTTFTVAAAADDGDVAATSFTGVFGPLIGKGLSSSGANPGTSLSEVMTRCSVDRYVSMRAEVTG